MKILVLDGGMGTTLEAQGHEVSTPMWGCELVHREPEVIAGVHRGYVEAGADLIETATYQLSLPALMAQGHSAQEAESIMHKAVTLAADAADSASTCGAVLSVGPFGATLSPGQEYAGFYPPPYGPRGFSPSGVNTNYASPSDIEGYISSIADFHLQRLRIYASHASWDRVEWIAFETIPVVAEIHGIRRAMATLAAEGRGKKFWIASAFPKGKPGQMAADGAPVDVGTVVDAMVRSVKGEALPDGVGINCTNPQFLPALVEAYTAALPRALRPWLVVYPDGGSVYDVATRTWSDAGRVAPALWARGLVEAVKGAEGWEGAIVGGCCKSSFGEVGALRKQVGRA